MDAARRVIDNGAVAVKGQDIAAVGTAKEIDARYTSKYRLDRGAAILMPGLINAHTHAPMALLRGIADDVRLQVWLENYIFPAEAKNVTPEFVKIGTQLACAEMMLSGTTTFTDMYYLRTPSPRRPSSAACAACWGRPSSASPPRTTKRRKRLWPARRSSSNGLRTISSSSPPSLPTRSIRTRPRR
jgi:5-methylthioadenosine/S-adenosylhomocysteine deaminase